MEVTPATPNLFILGAGRSGTTSLHHLLSTHPEIQVSSPKEPTFFCSYFNVVDNPVDYFHLFDGTARYRVDASHAYLTNSETAPLLHRLFPDARFIVTLRDPRERAYSLYYFMRYARHADGGPFELIDSLADALRAEPQRYDSHEFFANCRQYFWNFMYIRSAYYDTQLARYFQLFRREQFLITSLATLASNPTALSRRIAHFLDLDPAPFERAEFAPKNVGPPFPRCSQSDAILDAAFTGLTQRVDDLIGERLDWSM